MMFSMNFMLTIFVSRTKSREDFFFAVDVNMDSTHSLPHFHLTNPLKPFLEYVFLLMCGTVALDILLIALFNALSPVSHYQLSRIKLMMFVVLVNRLKASSFPFMILLFIPMLL